MSRTAQSASARPKRTPIASRNVLSVKGKDPEYDYRVVNDTGDRISQFIEAGYELVNASDVSIGDRRVDAASPEGSKAQVSVGKGEKAFLMRIKKEYALEDQKAKLAKIAELEQTIQNPASNKADYGSVKIERS